jgi:hypothetical protein
MSSGTAALGLLKSASGFAQRRSRAARDDGVCCDMSSPGTITVPDRVQPRKIFSHTTCRKECELTVYCPQIYLLALHG